MSLSSVKYSTVRPQGKTANYTANEKITFDIPDRYAYISGKNSYLYVELSDTSTFSDGSSTGIPHCLPPNLGGHALFSRVQYQATSNGKDIEDIDGYNTYVSVLKSWGSDFDEYEAMSQVEGVSAHTNQPIHRKAGKACNQSFLPAPNDTDDSTEMTDAVNPKEISLCLPIHLGMWSGIGDDNHVLPNGAMGGSQLHLYLADNNQVIQDLSSEYFLYGGNTEVLTHRNATDVVGAAITNGSNEITIADENLQWFSNLPVSGLCWRVSQVLNVFQNDGTTRIDGATHIKVVSVKNTGGQTVITTDHTFTSDVADAKVCVDKDQTRKYNINKIELRLLETNPTDPRQVLSSFSKGFNFKSTVLNKLSVPAGLTNSILNLPASNTKAMSLWNVPVVADNLNGINENNSLIYPQMDADANQIYTYQFQIQNNLIPNRGVAIRKEFDSSDNTIHYNQCQMACRSMFECRSVNDGADNQCKELVNPLFIPLTLAPMGNSFNLLNQEGQLRLSSSVSPGAKLHHLYTNHNRVLRIDENGVDIEL